jgi:hypothetical protein
LQKILDNLETYMAKAIAHYWGSRESQKKKQTARGVSDAGSRSHVTGGAQMDGFVSLVKAIMMETGIQEECIFQKTSVVLPGYFRPTKAWDLIVVKNGYLIAAVEAKSQAGPSFGNNFNNRTEEAIGSALDLWTAFREGAFNSGLQPFLGYFFMLEDCEKSNKPVRVEEPHFKVFPEFIGASYMKRYELLCRKLTLERHYTSACFVTSTADNGLKGEYKEPAIDLAFKKFAKSIISHVGAFPL